MTSTQRFELPFRIYYDDTDAGGVVYHANYLKFFDRTRTEWLHRLGLDVQLLADNLHIVFVVRKIAIEYHRSARLSDSVIATATIAAIGRASMTVKQNLLRGEELLCEALITMVCVDTQTWRPTPLPESMLEKFVIPPSL